MEDQLHVEGLGMDIRELTQEMNRFVRDKGWYDENSPKQQNERNLAVSIVLEAAEVLELYQWREAGIERPRLEEELADVMLYLLQLASVAGIDLEAAVLSKLAINHDRTW
jgi:dCTP diphosphatase